MYPSLHMGWESVVPNDGAMAESVLIETVSSIFDFLGNKPNGDNT